MHAVRVVDVVPASLHVDEQLAAAPRSSPVNPAWETFSKSNIFSPSVGSSFEDGIDETWTPVKRLVETQLIDRSNPMHSREQYFFDELDKETMDKLADIIDLQFKMIELSRKHGRKKSPTLRSAETTLAITRSSTAVAGTRTSLRCAVCIGAATFSTQS